MRKGTHGYGVNAQDGKVLWVPSVQSSDHYVKVEKTEQKERKYGCGEASCENKTCAKLHMKTFACCNLFDEDTHM